MNRERVKVKGNVTIERVDSFGKIIDVFNVDNLVVDGGLNFFASKITNNTDENIFYVGVGAGAGATQSTDTDLVERESLTGDPYFDPYVDETLKEIRYETVEGTSQITVGAVYSEEEVNGFSIKEVGLFTDAETMIARIEIPSESYFTKTLGELLNITWKITLG